MSDLLYMGDDVILKNHRLVNIKSRTRCELMPLELFVRSVPKAHNMVQAIAIFLLLTRTQVAKPYC